MTKYPAENDVAVLLIFFTRQETLKRTFDAIKKARPSRLLLYQDGSRNPEEEQKIEAAKQIVADEAIDWECEVHRNYHTENAGAWASNYQAQRWAFSLYEKCIVIEDDSTPAVSFIRFCKEMLDRYEHDERITMIAGYNHEEKTEAPYDYLFTSVFSIWGWASWGRVVNQWDDQYKVVDHTFDMHQLEAYVKAHGEREEKNGFYRHVRLWILRHIRGYFRILLFSGKFIKFNNRDFLFVLLFISICAADEKRCFNWLF